MVGIWAKINLFGWTSSPRIIWVPEVISGGLLGSGILLIFLQVSESESLSSRRGDRAG
jgi:hypothetical protein